jgi:hypothetical protein
MEIFDSFGRSWGPLGSPPPRPEALEIIRIDYSSPGFTDFAGIGKAVEQVRLFIQYVIDLSVWREHRRIEIAQREAELAQLELEMERVEQETIAKKIENVRQIINLNDDLKRGGLTYLWGPKTRITEPAS